MPCLFMENIGPDVQFDPEFVRVLFVNIADAAGCSPQEVELHVRPGLYRAYRFDGALDTNQGVHVFVEWHAGRLFVVKDVIARWIQAFLEAHQLGERSDITFRDYPHGQTFFFEGNVVT